MHHPNGGPLWRIVSTEPAVRLRPAGSPQGQRGLDPLELSDEQLQQIADAMQERPGVPGGASGDNPRLASGYTYLGQFVDHDLTFDASSSAQRRIDPEGRLSFRSPRFDLVTGSTAPDRSTSPSSTTRTARGPGRCSYWTAATPARWTCRATVRGGR